MEVWQGTYLTFSAFLGSTESIVFSDESLAHMYTMYMYMCGESWLAIKDSFNQPSQFSRLGILVSSRAYVFYHLLPVYIYIEKPCHTCTFMALCVLFVWIVWVFSFLLLHKLVCYTHVFPCTCTCHPFHKSK